MALASSEEAFKRGCEGPKRKGTQWRPGCVDLRNPVAFSMAQERTMWPAPESGLKAIPAESGGWYWLVSVHLRLVPLCIINTISHADSQPPGQSE